MKFEEVVHINKILRDITEKSFGDTRKKCGPDEFLTSTTL